MVLLPGRGDSAEDFVREGFFADLRQRPLSVDLVAADATLGYYAKNTLVERLSTDVLEPLLAQGYEQVWAIGNSMGGLGALVYALRKPGVLTGVLALAPFLGPRSLIHEIAAQGGLARWAAPPKASTIDEDNYQRQLWRWLQASGRGEEPGPEIYVGVGAEDGFAESVGLLAATLPAGHAWQEPGGHAWPVWRALLKPFLADSDFARACAAR